MTHWGEEEHDDNPEPPTWLTVVFGVIAIAIGLFTTTGGCW